MKERWSVARMILLVTFLALAFYVLNATLRYPDFGWVPFLGIVVWIFFVFGFAMVQPLYFWGKEKISDSPWVERAQIAGFLAIHYVSDIITFVMIRDLVGFSIWGGFKLQWWAWNGMSLYSGVSSFVLLLLPFVFLLLGYLTVFFGPYITKVKIVDSRLPAEFDGYRIAQLSDVHLGPMMGSLLCRKLLKRLKKAQFDALVLTGDIVDCDPERYADNLKVLQHMTARDGVFYCPGNHEYYWGLHRILKALPQHFQVLINDKKSISRGQAMLQLWGSPDPISKYFQDVQNLNWKLLTPQDSLQTYDVLLAHRPELADEAQERGFHLQLSGHTHAGQFFPWNYLIYFFQKYTNGLYDVESKFNHESMWLYVNQGTGFWGPPTRLGTYGEITVLELRKEKKKKKKKR